MQEFILLVDTIMTSLQGNGYRKLDFIEIALSPCPSACSAPVCVPALPYSLCHYMGDSPY